MERIVCIKVALTSLYTIVVFGSVAGFWFTVAHDELDHEYVDNILQNGGWVAILSLCTTVCSVVIIVVGFCKGWVEVHARRFTLKSTEDKACKMALQLSLVYLLLTWLFIPVFAVVTLGLILTCVHHLMKRIEIVLDDILVILPVMACFILCLASVCAFWFSVFRCLMNISNQANKQNVQEEYLDRTFLVCLSQSLLLPLISVLVKEILYKYKQAELDSDLGGALFVYLFFTWGLLIGFLYWVLIYYLIVHIVPIIYYLIVHIVPIIWTVILWFIALIAIPIIIIVLLVGLVVSVLFLPFILAKFEPGLTIYGWTANGIFWILIGLFFPLHQSGLFLVFFACYMLAYTGVVVYLVYLVLRVLKGYLIEKNSSMELAVI